MTDKPASGQILTFYSYKGGTGRSMALANVGYILATDASRRSRTVLLIDWDLEAPGLHRFFPQASSAVGGPSGGSAQSGLIDFFEVVQAAYAALAPGETMAAAAENLARIRAGILASLPNYIVGTGVPNLLLTPAGRFDDNYADRIRRFNWEGLHARDPLFFSEFRRHLSSRYDFVLIDSRTGLTDTSGICARQMPDKLVLVFAPNRQNIDGVLDVARKVKSFRVGDSADPRPLAIFPLASRIDGDVSELRDKWRKGGVDDEETIDGYQPAFERLFLELYELDDCSLDAYFDVTQITHDKYYAYGERVAARKGVTDSLSLGFKFASFTRRLITLDGPWEHLPEERLMAESREREEALRRTAEREREAALKARRLVRTLAVVGSIVILAGAIAFYQVLRRNSLPASTTSTASTSNTFAPRERVRGQIAAGQSVRLELAVPGGPRDYYRLSAETAGESKIAVNGRWSADAGSPVTFTFDAVPGSTYSLVLRESSEGYLGSPYDIVVNPLHAFDQFEPNDDAAHATKVVIGQPLQANVMDEQDVDWYEVSLSKPAEVLLEEVAKTLRPYVTVYDAGKNGAAASPAVPFLGNDEGSAAGQDVRLSVLRTAGGTFRVKVEGRRSSGAYKLTIRE